MSDDGLAQSFRLGRVLLVASVLPCSGVAHPARIEAHEAHARYAAAVYAADVKQRDVALKQRYDNEPDKVIPWDGQRETYLWDFFPPSFNCPWRERLGRFSEGGKVVCNWQALARAGTGCVVLTFGVRGDVSFEQSLARRTQCQIYAFDPTVSALPSRLTREQPCPSAGGIIHFERAGIGPTDDATNEQQGTVHTLHGRFPLRTLGLLAARVGARRISLLKIDCEGCEWEAFRQLHKEGFLARVDQLLIELHLPEVKLNKAGNASGVRGVFELFRACEAAGLYAFSWEVNHNAPGFLRLRPGYIEYSFVRATAPAMRVPPWAETEADGLYGAAAPTLQANGCLRVRSRLPNLGRQLPTNTGRQLPPTGTGTGGTGTGTGAACADGESADVGGMTAGMTGSDSHAIVVLVSTHETDTFGFENVLAPSLTRLADCNETPIVLFHEPSLSAAKLARLRLAAFRVGRNLSAHSVPVRTHKAHIQ